MAKRQVAGPANSGFATTSDNDSFWRCPTRKGKGFEAEAVQQIRIYPGQGRGITALDDRVADWWQRASALAPLRFRGIAQGLPSDG